MELEEVLGSSEEGEVEVEVEVLVEVLVELEVEGGERTPWLSSSSMVAD